MKQSLEKIKDTVVEVINERFFSPMYFYFIIAWLITNWKFVYILLFSDTSLVYKGSQISKIDLLSDLYIVNTPIDIFYNFIHLFLGPLLFSFVAVWWFTKAAEIFFRKYETFKQNKKVIQRELEYTEKVRFERMEREIRDIESDENDISFEDNNDFNESIDDAQEFPVINKIVMRPSEVLYNTDYQAYKEALTEWKEQKNIEDLSDLQRQQVIDEWKDDQRSRVEQNENENRF